MRLSKLWFPAAIVAIVLVIIVVGGRTEPDVENSLLLEQEVSTVRAPKRAKPAPEYDEDGRLIIAIGELRLHIPTSVNPSATATPPASRSVRLEICWPMIELPGECTSIANHVHIYVRLGAVGASPAYADRRESIDWEAPDDTGPFDSPYDGVWEHRRPETEKVFMVSLKETDLFGRHVVATAEAASRYRAHVFIDERLVVIYHFNEAQLETWPELHATVRDLVTSFIVED